MLSVYIGGTRNKNYHPKQNTISIILQKKKKMSKNLEFMKCVIRLPGSKKVGLKKVAKTCQIDFMVQCKGKGLVGGLVASACFLSILSIFPSNESHFHPAERNSAKISQMSFHVQMFREAILQKIPFFYEILSQTGRGGQSDFISLIQKK